MRGAASLAALVVLAQALVALPAGADAPAKSQPFLCSAEHLLVGAEWSACWERDEDRAQGLELNDVRYHGVRVLWKVGLPMSITRYFAMKAGPFKDTFGTSSSSHPGFGQGGLPIDAAACPRFLATGALADGGKVCIERSDGPDPAIAVWARWDIVNYRFVNGYVMRASGAFEPKILLGGLLLDQAEIGGATAAGSKSAPHAHHVYWRFDFDVDGAANDTIEEYARAEAAPPTEAPTPLPPTTLDLCHTGGSVVVKGLPVKGGLWCPVVVEGPRERAYAAATKWRVVDASSRNAHGTPRSFELIPGSAMPGDGVSAADAWALAYQGDSAELGYEVPAFPAVDAPLAAYATPPQSTFRTDVVLWYVEHVLHEPRDEENPTMTYHEVGPTLLPRNFLAGNAGESTFP